MVTEYKGKQLNTIFNEIKRQLNENDKSPTQRVNTTKDILGDNFLEHDDLNEYIKDPHFINNFVGIKNGINGNPLSEYTYYGRKLSGIADYLLKFYDDYENARFHEYTPISNGKRQQDEKDRNNKFIVGMNTAALNDEQAERVNDAGREVHIDMLDDTRTHIPKQLSRREEKRKRWQEIYNNLDRFPELREKYNQWKFFGLKYGLDASYNKQQKATYRKHWIGKFKEEDNPHTPKQRLLNIRETYHKMGYELSVRLKELKGDKTSKSGGFEATNSHDDVLEGVIDLSDRNHVNGLLHIRKEGRKYIPVFAGLEKKYINETDTATYKMIQDFYAAIKWTDLKEEDKEIVLLLLDKHNDEDIYFEGENVDPYPILNTYINEKYNHNRSKANLRRYINNTIARKVANTYHALFMDETGTKKCNHCQQQKLLLADNWPKDNKGKDGFKNKCKMCGNS